MNLPTSRNTTYGANTPILSVDIDAIQDCIVGAKHPVIERPIHGSGWISPSALGTFNGSIWTGPAGGFEVRAALDVPIGDRITHVTFTYNRANAGTVTVTVVEVKLDGTGSNNLATFADNASGNVVTTKDLAAINYTTRAGYVYFILTNFNGASSTAGGTAYHASWFHDRL